MAQDPLHAYVVSQLGDDPPEGLAPHGARFGGTSLRSQTSPSHAHIWHLADGTGLHAPHGELAVEEGTGRLCCHLCGHWFRSLGSHVRAHGYTAETYRAELGLCRGEPLTDKELSAAISARQKVAFEANETIRELFAVGQGMARCGALGRAAAQARAENPLPASALARQTRALKSGRDTVASQRKAALERLLEESGKRDLPSYLRDRYQHGASLAQLASETGLGRARLRAEVQAAGIATRNSGQNTPAGRRSRAVAAETAAARRVGTDDLLEWLRTRRNEGWTLTALGDAVGHSGHWVNWRLQPVDQVT